MLHFLDHLAKCDHRHLVVILKEVKFNTKYHRIVTGLLTGTNQHTIFDYIVVRYVRPLVFDLLFNEHLQSKARVGGRNKNKNKMWK